VFVERVWGKEDLSFLYPSRPSEPRRVGEVWLTGERNCITNGPWAGLTLEEAARTHPQALLGASIARTRPAHGAAFPLLVKFIFTSEKLSVQVHPSDAYAREREGSRGKTEMWHMLRTDPGATLAVGFRDEIREGPRLGQADLRKAVESGDVEAMLDWTEVRPGDTFFVPAGTVHAIGPGLVLCEIQQNSDITYRFYDYKRPGTDGRPRPLHIEQALDVLKWRTSGGRTVPLEVHDTAVSRACIAACAYFTTEKVSFSTPFEHRLSGRVEIWIALEGEARFDAGGEAAVCCRGQAVVLPAALSAVNIRPLASAVFLRTFPPEPETDIRAPWLAQGFSEDQLSRVCFPAQPPLGKPIGSASEKVLEK
jgi:mannose-6-phosphate isomerase